MGQQVDGGKSTGHEGGRRTVELLGTKKSNLDDRRLSSLSQGRKRVAVKGPAVLSGYRSIVAFGVLNLVGLTAVAILYVNAFASLWCIFAAAASVLVFVHMLRRRRLPDPHRYRGVPLAT